GWVDCRYRVDVRVVSDLRNAWRIPVAARGAAFAELVRGPLRDCGACPPRRGRRVIRPACCPGGNKTCATPVNRRGAGERRRCCSAVRKETRISVRPARLEA